MTATLRLDVQGLERWAWVSSCKLYRYELGRRWWSDGPMGLVLGINPSVADSVTDDATVRVLHGFGARWGWGGYRLANPFAFRATDQRELLAVDDPVGPENDAHLARLLTVTDGGIVVAWGAGKTAAVRRLLEGRLHTLKPIFAGRELWCLGRTSDGAPRHPLMLAYDTPLEPWSWP